MPENPESETDASPAILLITREDGGDVARHVTRRARDLREQGLRVIELRPDTADEVGGAASLAGLGVRRVEIHHTLGLDPSVLDLPANLGVTYDVVVHDYGWICPRLTLTSANGVYCGQPAADLCERCLADNGSLLDEAISVADLRDRSAGVLAAASRVIVPTRDVARRLRRAFPDLDPVVVPWEDEPAPAPAPGHISRTPVRVAVLGAVGAARGEGLLEDCCRDAADRRLPLDFVSLGEMTGDEADERLAREGCHVALLPSLWPETWSYALTHLRRAGLPVIAFDLGAMAERLGRDEKSVLLPLTAGAAAVNDALIAAAEVGAGAGVVVSLKTRGDGETWIQGVRVSGPEGLRYAVRPAGGEPTPWSTAGAWCADAAGARPLIAFAARHPRGVTYQAAFASGATASAADGDFCQSPYPNDPMTGLTVNLSGAGV